MDLLFLTIILRICSAIMNCNSSIPQRSVKRAVSRAAAISSASCSLVPLLKVTEPDSSYSRRVVRLCAEMMPSMGSRVAPCTSPSAKLLENIALK